MLLEELLASLTAAALIWGAYALIIRFFPVVFRDCSRRGREQPGLSLIYGVALFSASLALWSCLLYLLRATSGVGIGMIFILFQAAGLAVGLAALVGKLGLMDPEKYPYSAIALGLAMLWIARMFSKNLSNMLGLLAGIYGAGAIIMYFRNKHAAAPPAEPPAAKAGPAPSPSAQPSSAAEPERKTAEPEKKRGALP